MQLKPLKYVSRNTRLGNWSRGLSVLAIIVVTLPHFGGVFAAADVVNHFLPIILLGASVLAAMQIIQMLRTRQPSVLTLALACSVVLTGGRFISPELSSSGGEGAGGSVYELLVFNVLKDNRASQSTRDWIRNADSDFVVLLEASPVFVAGLSDKYPYQVNCQGNKRPCSTVVLSKHRPLSFQGHAKGDSQNRKTLSAAEASFCLAGRELSVLGVHLARPWPTKNQERDIKDLMPILQARRGRHLILAGDFNLTPWSFRMREIDTHSGLRRVSRALPTWPANTIMPALLPIDHVFVGHAVAASRPRTFKVAGSDHRPVKVRFDVLGAGVSCARSPD